MVNVTTTISLLVAFFAGLVVLILIGLSFYSVKQWERAVITRFGKIVRVDSEGLHTKIPIIDKVITLDFRTQTLDLRGQQAITKDNISVGIDAVVFMRFEDASKVILNIDNPKDAIAKFVQTAMRNIIGEYTLDELLSSREKVAESLKKQSDEFSSNWGIDIQKAELQEISLPTDMKRAFAVQAEAERESRAIKIKAQAELDASKVLSEAAGNLKDPNVLQLRILETIKQVSKDQSNTIIFALPTEVLISSGIGGLAAAASINSSENKRKKTEALKVQGQMDVSQEEADESAKDVGDKKESE
jgi:regulator of protease activity HflC (stomatin/prohibitin superfamily)